MEGARYIHSRKVTKVVMGVAILATPGGLTITTAYKIGNRLVKDYARFKSEKENENVRFFTWLNRHARHDLKKDVHKKIHQIRKVGQHYGSKLLKK